MKFKELKNKSAKDLTKLLEDSQNNLREMRFKVANDQLKNIRELRTIKRSIQRIKFLLNQKDEEVKESK